MATFRKSEIHDRTDAQRVVSLKISRKNADCLFRIFILKTKQYKEEAASGDKPGAAIFMSVFLIKLCFVAIGAEQNVRHP